jgi:Flp pilus assembly pilin Flp
VTVPIQKRDDVRQALRGNRQGRNGMLRIVQTRILTAVTQLGRASGRDDGQSIVEYALIVSLIAVVAIVALQTTGSNLHVVLNKIANET